METKDSEKIKTKDSSKKRKSKQSHFLLSLCLSLSSSFLASSWPHRCAPVSSAIQRWKHKDLRMTCLPNCDVSINLSRKDCVRPRDHLIQPQTYPLTLSSLFHHICASAHATATAVCLFICAGWAPLAVHLVKQVLCLACFCSFLASTAPDRRNPCLSLAGCCRTVAAGFFH